MILNYGKPYSVKKFDALFQEDPNKAYRKFILELSMAMKEVLVVESHSEHYTNHASVFTRANENLGFKALKSLVSTHKKFPKDKVYGFLKPIILLLELPNFIPFALINYAKKNILKKPVFHASVKLGVAVVIMPFWFLFTLVFLGLTFNLKVALIVFAIQILTLFIRILNTFNFLKENNIKNKINI